MKKINFGQFITLAVVAIVILLGVAISFFIFSSQVKDTLSEQLSSYLVGSATQNATATANLLTSEIDSVEGVAAMLSKRMIATAGPMADEEIISSLNRYVQKKSYKRMGIIDLDGNAVTTDKLKLDLSKRDFFAEAKRGKSGISKTVSDQSDNEPINVIYAPVYSASGYISKILFASYPAGAYEDMLALKLADSKGEFFITTSNGESIINKNEADKPVNITDYIQKHYVVASLTDTATMRSKMGSGLSGFFTVTDNFKNGHYVIYTPLLIENWVCIYIIPQSLADHQSDTILSYGGSLMLVISILLIFLGVVITFIVYKNNRQIYSTNRHIALAEERYRILTEQTNNVIFDYNITFSSIFYSTVFERKFGFVPHAENFPTCALEGNWIHSEDKELFVAAFKKCEAGKPYLEAEIRLLSTTGHYIWCLFKMTTLFNSENKAYRIVGKIADIDSTKRKNTLLTERSTRDGLTGLYNKETVKELITNYINLSSATVRSCLLLVDIDNFKTVNDGLGHLMGDKCICGIAKKMIETFSENEILGRVGGDEFIVFIKEVDDERVAHALGMKLCDAMSSFFIADSAGNPYKITASIGVAVTTPETMATYDGLFKQADTAMYCSKKTGKNRCSNYDESQENMLSGRIDEEDTISEIDSPCESAFTALSMGKSFSEAVLHFLSEICEQLQLSHIYILERVDNTKNFRITFEYYTDSSAMTKKAPRPLISMSAMQNYSSLFNADGVFYYSDIHALDDDIRECFFEKNAVSVVSAGIFRDDKLVGCLSGDDCNNSRVWSNGELANMILFSKIVGNFIIGRSKFASISKVNPSENISFASVDIDNLKNSDIADYSDE